MKVLKILCPIKLYVRMNFPLNSDATNNLNIPLNLKINQDYH